MKQHTSNFKQTISTIGRQFDDYITYGNTTLRAELSSISLHYEGSLLKSIMKQLDIESSVEIPKGTKINYKKGLLIGNSYEYLDYGSFYVYKVEKQEDKDNYNITCYDALLFSMVEYTGMQITFPITVRSYLNNLCSLMQIPFISSGDTFANYNRQLTVDPYIDAEGNSLGYTIRDILDELSQVTASNICIGTSNNVEGIEVRYITDTQDTLDENQLKNVNVNFGEKYGPINSIVLSRTEVDNVYLQDEESIEDNGLCELKIVDNQIMNFDDRSDYLPDILDKLDGLEYYINDYSSTGVCYYEPCDMYNISIGDNNYQCIMFNDEINQTTGLEELVHTEMPEQAETDYTKSDKTDRRINQTNLTVNKQQQQIQALITTTSQYDSEIANLTLDVGRIASQVQGIYDLTRQQSGNKSITLEKCMQGYILEMHIYGNNTVFDYLYPEDDLYPADDLYPYGDSRIEVEDKDGNITTYELGINEVLRANADVRDEYVLIDNHAQVIRRVNPDGTTKELETIEDIGKYTIYVSEGDNIIRIKNYTAPIQAKYIIQNAYTDQFTTQIQTQSKIEQASNQIMLEVSETYETQGDANKNYSRLTQTANEISSEVSKKVGNNEVISKINQSAEAVTIQANKISLAGKNINLTGDNVSISSNKMNIANDGTITVIGGEDNGNVSGLNIRAVDSSDSNVYTGMAPRFLTVKNSGTNYVSMQTGTNSIWAGLYVFADSSSYINMTSRSSGSTATFHSSSYSTQVSDWGIITPQVTQTSKAEEKKNFEKIENALEQVLKTDIYRYHLKSQKDTDKKHVGFVIGKDFNYSHDITAVDEHGNEIGVETYSMTSVLWQAVKEQQQQIEELKKEIELLKGENYGKD